MGTPTAPSYANIFMAEVEEKLLASATQTPFRASWRRFIDDVNFILSGDQTSLDSFIDHANKSHPTIELTFDISTTQIPFLDVLIYIKDNALHTTLYSKPTDSHAYLLPQSCHPPHTFRSIPYSQTLRIRRICSEENKSKENVQKLEEYLKQRKYPETITSKSISKAKHPTREELLQYKPPKNQKRTPLVVTYHPNLTSLPHITRNNLHILHESEEMKSIFPEPPLISYRRCRSLRDLLVSAKVASNPPPGPQSQHQDDKSLDTGSHKCNAKKCCVCPFMVDQSCFQSTTTGKKYPIGQHINCKSTWVIYLITCKKCKLQYVGKTTTSLYTRFNNTRSDIKKYNTNRRKEIPIAAHFNLRNHSVDDISLMGIEQIRKKSEAIIRKRESFWILTLKTLAPKGINADE